MSNQTNKNSLAFVRYSHREKSGSCVYILFHVRTHRAVTYYASKNRDAPAAQHTINCCVWIVCSVCVVGTKWRNEQVQQPAATLRHNTLLLHLSLSLFFVFIFVSKQFSRLWLVELRFIRFTVTICCSLRISFELNVKSCNLFVLEITNERLKQIRFENCFHAKSIGLNVQ